MIEVSHNLAALNQTLAEYQRVSGLTTAQVLIKKGSDLSFRLSEKLKQLKAGKGGITAQNLAMLKGGKGIRVRDSIMKSVMEKVGAAVRIVDRLRHTNPGGKAGRSSAAQSHGKGISGVRFGFKGKTEKTADGRTVLQNDVGKTTNRKGLNLRNLIVKREISAREGGRGYVAWAGMMKVKKLSATNKQLPHIGRLHQQLGDLNLSFTDSDGSLTFHWGGEGKDGKPIQSGVALAKPRQKLAIASAFNEVRADMLPYIARKHTEALQASLNKAVSAARMVKV